MTERVLAGRYQVLSTLGQGAHGTVYRVRDTWLSGRELALKALNVSVRVAPTWQARFREEFRAMSRLKHPHIVAVDDFGKLDDAHQYLTMELVPGCELSAMIGPPMPLDQAYTYLSQLLSALELIHGRGYLHRDIKPANIRITPSTPSAPFGLLKLIDFGLVSPLLATAHGGLSGTPAYMAPEAITGQGGNASQDLYAVGCLAFEMLTGRPPYVGSTREVLQAHIQKMAPSLQDFYPDAPQALGTWIANLLEKDPTRRISRAQEALVDLTGISGRGTVQVAHIPEMNPLQYPPLLARETAITSIEKDLSASSGQGGTAILLGGPSGIGKTRILEEIALHAKLRGDLVLWLQGHRYTCDPYAVYVRMIKQLAHSPDLSWEVSEQQEMGAWWSRLSQTSVRSSEQPAILAVLERCLRQAALQRPLLLVLDDMHWFDEPSLRATLHLMRDRQRTNIAIIGSYLPDATHTDSPILHAIHEGFANRYEVQPFQEPQISDFLTTVLQGIDGAAYHARILHPLCGGNPALLIEYLRSMMAANTLAKVAGQWRFLGQASDRDAPPDVTALIEKRLAHLNLPTRQLLEIVSVVGPVRDIDMLRRLCEGTAASGRAFDEAFDTLLSGQFLLRKLEGSGYVIAVAHQAVQNMIYGHLPEQTRTDWYDQCLKHLEERAAGADWLAELTHHARHGSDCMKAYRYLDQMGDHLHTTGVENQASAHWQAALKALRRGGIAPDDPRCRELLGKISEVSIILAPKTAAQALEELLTHWPPDAHDDDSKLLATGRLAVALGSSGCLDEALVLAQSLQELAGQDRMRRGAASYLAIPALIGRGHIDEATHLARQAASDLTHVATTHHSPFVGSLIESVAAMNARVFQGLRPDYGHVARASAIAEKVGLADPLYARFYPALWQSCSGRYAEAVPSIEFLLKRSRQLGGQTFPWIQLLGSTLLWQRGEFELALQQSQRALDTPYMHEIALGVLMLRQVMGECLLSLGRYQEGLNHFEALINDARKNQFHLVALRATLGHIDIQIEQQLAPPRDAIETQLDDILTQTREGSLRNPLLEALTLRTSSLLHLKTADPTRALHILDQALDIVQGHDLDNWFECGRLEFEKSNVLRALKRPEEAKGARQRASEWFVKQRNPYWQHLVSSDNKIANGTLEVRLSPESRAKLAKGLQF